MHYIKILKFLLSTVLWNAIYLLIYYLLGDITLEQIPHIFLNLEVPYNNHLWFMGALITLYIFFPILKITYNNNIKVYICFTCTVILLTIGNKLLNMPFTLFSNIVLHKNIEFSLNVFGFFNPFRGIFSFFSLSYFCIGGLAYLIFRTINIWLYKRKQANILFISIFLISILFLFIWGIYCSHLTNKTWDTVWNGYDTVFTFIAVLMLIIISNSLKELGSLKIFRIISQNTLGIYFVHSIIIFFFKTNIFRFNNFFQHTWKSIYVNNSFIYIVTNCFDNKKNSFCQQNCLI